MASPETSRVCVKGLPKYLKEPRLREIFSSQGDVTDVRIMTTQRGYSRQFGFVGFRTPQQARKALKHFNRSYIDTARITVELAIPRQMAKPNRDPASGMTDFTGQAVRPSTETATEQKLKQVEADARFGEFVGTMQSSSSKQSHFWANDDGAQDPLASLKKLRSRLGNKRRHPGADHSSDSSSSSSSSSDDDEEEDDDEDDANGSDRGASVDDLAFLKQKSRQAEELMGERPSSSSYSGVGVGGRPKRKEQHDPPTSVLSASRLFVRNLSYSTQEADLRDLFQRFGELTEVSIPVDGSGRSKGFAFIRFDEAAHADLAQAELDGSSFHGRLLHILRARAKPAEVAQAAAAVDENDDDAMNALTYKTKKALQQRKNAEKRDNWNTLFLRSDTVVDAVAKQYGVEKSDILDRDGDNMAVRLALAETQVIAETKKWLEENGVQLSAFEGARRSAPRSDKLILVKNITFSITSEDLTRAFARFGSLTRILLPPSKTMALVEFGISQHARKAFRSLAYTKLQNQPLYLEWAPVGALKASPNTGTLQAPVAVGPAASSSAPQKARFLEEQQPDALDEDVANETGTVFVKNLHFDTSESALETAFQAVGPIRKVTVAKRKNPKYKQGGRDAHKEMLSMGYGFVEFQKREDAARALRELDGMELDGHTLVLKIARSGSAAAGDAKDARDKDTLKAKSTKIVVKNIPFQATASEIRRLFGTFGQLKRCRLPKKVDGGHRGFGFVEFVTKNEAANAVKALSATHLYGRHLVVEWASEDDSLEAARERAKQAASGSGYKKKRRKIEFE